MASPVMTATGLSTKCPYPACGRLLPASPCSCGCEYREPVTECAACGVCCPAEARFCRGCRAPLPPQPVMDGRKLITSPPAEFHFVPGVFHTPPVVRNLFAWCLSTEGEVWRLSLEPGAVPRAWATLGSKTAGFNRYSIVEAVFGKSPARRPVCVAIDPEGIWMLPLTEHQGFALYRPAAGKEIVANASPQQSIRFGGIAATPDAFAFLERSQGAGEAILAIRYFSENRAGEQPFRVEGNSFLGPVMDKGLVTVCSDEEVSVYRIAEQRHESYEFKNFKPMFGRSAAGLSVPPGGMPLWAGVGDRGLEVRVAGARAEKLGWLRVFMDKNYDDFLPLPEGSSIALAHPSGLCVNLLDTIDFLGVDRAPGRFGRLEPRMPVGYSSPFLAYFDRASSPGNHELTVMANVALGVRFNDKECHPDSICGMDFSARGLVISYFIPSRAKSEPGVKFACWRLTE